MSSLDDWSPPVSPSLLAAMEMDVILETCPSENIPEMCPSQIIPETCPSQIEGLHRKENIVLSQLSDINGFSQDNDTILDDLPFTSTLSANFNDGQASPLQLTEVEITPDVIMTDEDNQDDRYKPIPFCCKRYKGKPSDRVKALQRLLNDTDTVLLDGIDSTEIFSSHCVMDVLPDTITQMFSRLKQITSKINHGNVDSDSDYQSYREQIVDFYTFVKKFLYKLPNNLSKEDEETVERVVSLLHSTVIYIDRLSDMKYDVTLSTSVCDFHRFHMDLDIYWNTIEILVILDRKYTGLCPLKKISSSYSLDEGESRPLLSQMIQVVVWELVAVAISKFQKKNNQDLIHSSPFDCSCVRETWRLLACVLNEKGESFWVNLHEVIQILLDTETKVPEDIEIDSDVYMYPPVDNINLNDNSKFCIWFLTNLAVLVSSGENKVVTTSNYYDVNAVIKRILNKGEINEIDLRFYLRCCQQLCTVWEPNNNLLVLFWDYFYKRMNYTFQLKTVSINSLQTVSKTPSDLLERCKQYSKGQPSSQKQSETSYQQYLGLLGNHLRRLVETSSMQEWKQMKGRIYSKFHQRRIQELTETGLNNFTNLFLCLALTADLEDVSTKLFGFYDMVEMNRQNAGKCMMTWKGMISVILLYIQRQIDVRFLANKLSTAFNNVCLEFEVFESDPSYRHGLWKLINIYLDGTQEIFDSSTDLSLSQHVLIGEGYGKLLKICRNNEVPTVITGLQDIVNKVRVMCTSEKRNGFGIDVGKSGQVEAIYNAVFTHVWPALKDLCQSQTAHVQLADILAELSLLALDCKPDDYFVIMKLMLHNENINKNVVCRYLSHIVTVDSALDLLSSHMTNYQTVLVQTWIRSAVFVPSTSQQLQSLNRSMLNLPEIRTILMRASYVVPEEPDKIIFHVFKAIQMLYDKSESWKDKIELRDKVTEYTKDIHRHVTPYLQTLQPVETLSTAYSVIGYLVKCCSHLIYVKSKPNCPLPDIINTMIVPHTMFKKDKPTSPVFLGLIRDSLHLFVSGLALLDFKRDPFIQRRLKDIVTIYLVKFWNTAGSSSSLVHPLVMSLKGSFIRQPSESSISFRQYMLELVKENFMTITPTHYLCDNYQMALYFTREIINRTVNKEVLAGDLSILVCPILTIHLQCESISTQKLCQVLLQQIVDAGSSHQRVATRELVGEELMSFINRFKKIKLNQAIKLLEKLPKSGSCYVQKILPRIEHNIVEYESFRGSGQDTRLRQTYHSLIQMFHTV